MSQPTPLVSVTIPCYKQAHLVATAVHSVLDQTYKSIEVIVVDNQSPDDVASAVSRFGARVQLVRQPNRGVNWARNAGIAVAQGDLQLFLDADDTLERDALQRHIDARITTGAEITVSGWREVTPDGSILLEQATPDLKVDVFHGLLRHNLAVVHCFLLPTHALHAVGGFSTWLAGCEDWEMWVKLAAAGYKFGIVPGTLATYLRYPGSVSKGREHMYDSLFALMEHWKRFHPSCNACRSARKASLAAWADTYFRWDIALSLQTAGSFSEVLAVLGRASRRVRRDPSTFPLFVKAIAKGILRHGQNGDVGRRAAIS